MQQTKQEIIEYYDQFYASGDFEYYPPEVTEKILAALCRKARVPAGARVLDLGCGTGYYTSIFHKMGYDAVGIDISETGIAKAREAHPGVEYNVDDATDLHFPKASFDAVFSLGVSVMNTRDHSELHTYVRHLMTFMKPGGKLLFLGGSDLSGTQSRTSNWIFHTWGEIRKFIPDGGWTIHGPYLSHFRLLAVLPSLALNFATTALLRLPVSKIVRKVIFFVENH